MSKHVKIKQIVHGLIIGKRYSDILEVLEWPYAVEEEGVLESLIKNNQQGLARSILHTSGVKFPPNVFLLALENQQYDLCVDLLAFEAYILPLRNSKVQIALITLLDKGESCQAGIEMLSRVPNRD